ncbi:MAG: DUF1214 domain-containing protein [Burkholderiales bacterium]|nr:MAG: DUF1214 domain-containing protein [Burkholderiales bacterium]
MSGPRTPALEPTGPHRPARRRSRRRAFATGAAVLALGIAIGLGSAWLAVRREAGIAAGPWRASLLAGSADADAWTRARVAIGGLLALNREETMYYVATHDYTGAALRSRCTYRVEGTPPPARWWSVTAYAEDFFLFDAPQRRYSVNGETARLDERGRFAFVTGPAAPAAPIVGETVPWLPTPGDRGLLLTLRVYNPEAALQAAPASLDPPRIEPVGVCR